MRALGITIIAFTLVGCHAPKPDWSFFGATKVPTHGTGTYQTSEEMNDTDYYNPNVTEPENRSSSTRNDGRLVAIDITDRPDETTSSNNGSREIFRSRSSLTNGRTRTVDRNPAGIRAATRPRDDDGFRAVPVRITRRGVERASYSEEVSDEESAFVPSAAQVLLPRENALRSADSLSTSTDVPRRLGENAFRARGLSSRETRSTNHRTAAARDDTSTTIDGWSTR